MRSDRRGALIGFADGDARRLLNMLEQIATAARRPQRTRSMATSSSTRWRRACGASTRAATQFYDQISALHKSVRGSAPDAALYWLVRMLDGGADPLYVGRRLVRMAIEDIGLADPARAAHRARRVRNLRAPGSARKASSRWPRRRSTSRVAPKSNAAYEAYNARARVRRARTARVRCPSICAMRRRDS